MNRKLIVDAIIGLNLGEIYGKYRVYSKTSENLNEKVDFKEIPYECKWRYNLPYKDLIYRMFFYPQILKKHIRTRADITHIFSQEETYLLNRLKFDSPKVATCLDLIPLIFKDNSRIPMNTWFMKYSIKGMRNADKIISISEHTKNDLIKYIKVPSNKIETVYLGVDKQYKRLSTGEVDNIKKKYQLGEKFILYLGSEQPRKNFTLLLKSFHKLKTRHGLEGIKLVKVGRPQLPESQRNTTFDLIDQLKIRKNVIFIDYVPEEDLPALYNASDLFVFPSLYEGFGLPVLEAMACGVPVITSNSSSLPEVVGDAGIMVDPYDVDGLAGEMYKVWTDEDLKEDLRKRGTDRAKMFSWERTADKTFNIYKEVLGE